MVSLDSSMRIDDRLFDRFVIVDLLGSGAQSLVARAFDEIADEDVVIKQFLGASSRSDDSIEGAFFEQMQGIRIDSCYVIAPTESYVDDTGRYCVEPLVEGHTLEAALRRAHARSPRQLESMACQLRSLLLGCRDLHDAGFVHRDIKPANIMLWDNGAGASLIDLGIAGSLESPAPGTAERCRVLGTYPYLSPEQLKCPGDVDERSDLFTLGVVVAEWAGVAAVPKDVGDAAELSLILERFSSTCRSETRPSIDSRIVDLCAWLTEPTPANRPGSATEVVEQIDVLSLKPQSSRPVPQPSSCSGCRRPLVPAMSFCMHCGRGTSADATNTRCLACGRMSGHGRYCLGCGRAFPACGIAIQFDRGPLVGHRLRCPCGVYSIGRATLCPNDLRLSRSLADVAVDAGGGVKIRLTGRSPIIVDGARCHPESPLGANRGVSLGSSRGSTARDIPA